MFLKSIFNYIHEIENKHALLTAISYILISYFFHAASLICFKSAHYQIVAQSLYLRAFISLIILYKFAYKQNWYPEGKLYYIIISQGLVAIALSFNFYGINLISASESAILFATNSIWSQLIVSIKNKEKITKSRMINSIICIIGVTTIVNPSTNIENNITHIIGCLCVLFGCFIISIGFIIMKEIGKTVPPTIIISYLHIIVMLITGVQAYFIREFEYFDNYFFYIGGFVLFTLLGQLIQFRAQTMVTYDKLCNYTYCQMLYVIILDYLLFGKILSLNGFIGGFLILFGVFNQLSQDKKLQEQQK